MSTSSEFAPIESEAKKNELRKLQSKTLNDSKFEKRQSHDASVVSVDQPNDTKKLEVEAISLKSTNDTHSGRFVEAKTPKESGKTPRDFNVKTPSVTATSQSNVEEKLNLSLPSTLVSATDECATFLRVLQDSSVLYVTFAKACLKFCQFCANGSSSNISYHEIGSRFNSLTTTLVHGGNLIRALHRVFPILIHCAQTNTDRRCRILALHSLTILTRSFFSTVRTRPFLSNRLQPNITNQLEEEMSTDVPAFFMKLALDDSDDGIAACSLASIGSLTSATCASSNNTIDDDEFLREVRSIAFNTSSLPSTSLNSVVDDDPIQASRCLQHKIYENYITPKLQQLIERLINFKSVEHTMKCVPVMTACLLYTQKATHLELNRVGREAFSKRWSELDSTGLIDTFVKAIIIPALENSDRKYSALARCSAMNGIRLANANSARPWVSEVARLAVIVFKEELHDCIVGYARHGLNPGPKNAAYVASDSCFDDRLTSIAALLIALRAIPLHQRIDTLTWLVNVVSTTIPSTVVSCVSGPNAGVRVTNRHCEMGNNFFRKPARVGIWTEIALSFFKDSSEKRLFVPNSENRQIHDRAEYLKVFLTSPSMIQITADINISDFSSVLVCKDEILLAFATVAIHTGREKRKTNDGSLHAEDHNRVEVREWLNLVGVLLSSFTYYVNTGPAVPTSYLDEDLSLSTAALAAYVQLIQEYLHFAGLLNDPVASVAMKLVANACPPHLLWDAMTESAEFLFDLPSHDYDLIDSTTVLMDELISRELKQGIRSQHMKLFIVSLAADHWVECRVQILKTQTKQQLLGLAKSVDASKLNSRNARDILTLLSPKRVLSSICKDHEPILDANGKVKRDPLKKLAFECLCACVACIENIALMTCQWRRFLGQSTESKNIVNMAVGILQGKMDESTPSELLISIIGQTCDDAVARIQAFYEDNSSALSLTSGSTNALESFPQSKLLNQLAKVKIKPLVSTSKRTVGDNFVEEYLMQSCRQIATARTSVCCKSRPMLYSQTSTELLRPNYYRLLAPCLTDSSNENVYYYKPDARSSWGKSTVSVSAGSDPIQVIVAYTKRRFIRADGVDEFRLIITMQVHNVSAINFDLGLRLELKMIHNNFDHIEADDPLSKQMLKSLNLNLSDLSEEISSVASSIVYKDSLNVGDYITWELCIDEMPSTCITSIFPSIDFRNVQIETDDLGMNRVFPFGDNEPGKKLNINDMSNVATDEVRLPLKTVSLSPMLQFHPCPFVFFADVKGSANSFRLLWFRLAHHLAPLTLETSNDPSSNDESHDNTERRIGRMSELAWEPEAIPNGRSLRLWAFQNLRGSRVYCVLTEYDCVNEKARNSDYKFELHFRSDDRTSLYCIAGCKWSRDSIVRAMLPGMFARSSFDK